MRQKQLSSYCKTLPDSSAERLRLVGRVFDPAKRFDVMLTASQKVLIPLVAWKRQLTAYS